MEASARPAVQHGQFWRQTEIPGTRRRWDVVWNGKQAEASGLVLDIQVVTPSSPES